MNTGCPSSENPSMEPNNTLILVAKARLLITMENPHNYIQKQNRNEIKFDYLYNCNT